MHNATMALLIQGFKCFLLQYLCFKCHNYNNLCLPFLCAMVVLCVAQSHIIKIIPESQCQKGDSPCRTLDWYNQNSNGSFMTSNTKVKFLKGVHTLSTSIAEVRNCKNLTIIGMGEVSYNMDGMPQPTTWINCTESFSSGFVFLNSTDIHLKNIGLGSCSRNTSVCGNECSAALAFQQGSNISLYRVVIDNTHGVGLHIDDVFSSVSIDGSAFMKAGAHSGKKQANHLSTSTRYRNARLWYGQCDCSKQYFKESTVLKITASWFIDGNMDARGLEVSVHCPNVHVLINSVIIGNNSEGNLQINVTNFDDGSQSCVKVSNSWIHRGRGALGSGMEFLSHTQGKNSQNSSCIHSHHILNIYNTTFVSNYAGSDNSAISLRSSNERWNCMAMKIAFQLCFFTYNYGIGPTISVFRKLTSTSHLSSTLNVSFEHCEFYHNTASNFPILDIVRTNIAVSNSFFTRNNGTAISLHNSYLNIYGIVRFQHNNAEYGAALKILDQSVVFLHKYSHIQFINNSALIGGALFVQEANVDINNIPLCIFQPVLPQGTPIEDFNNSLGVEFINNTAAIDGDAIYGGSITNCYTITKYSYHGCLHQFNSLYIFQQYVNVLGQPGPSWISSRPQGVCFCHDNETVPHYSCQTEHPVINTYPGARFSISVITVGQLNGSTSGIIQATLKKQARFHKLVSHSISNYSNQCVTLTFSLLTNLSRATLYLQPLSKYVINTFGVKVNVQMSPCPLGFELTLAEDNYKCDCNSIFQYHLKRLYEFSFLGDSIICDINTVILTVKSTHLWFGCLKFDDESHCETFGTSNNCEFCLHGLKNFTITKFNNNLCPFGQTGILCGQCKPGLSRTLDMTLSHTCQICSNKRLALYVLGFILSGLFLVLLLAILNITVTDGTINGLVFYATVFHGNHFFFTSDVYHHHYQKPYQAFWVFIAWLNLHTGLKLCAYNGLDGYQYIWLNFGFVFYLLFIQAVIIFLSRRFIFFTRLFGRNVLKVLATLLFMSHSKLMYSCYRTFQFDLIYFSSINTTIPEYNTVWHFDGNLPYLGFKHAVLFVVALFCFIFAFFFMFSLLFSQCLQRWSDRWCLRWVERLRPFYEVFTGPCHDNYRFWPGLLYFLRSGLYALSMYLSSYNEQLQHLKLFLTSAICILIMTLACIFPHGVYKIWYLNVLELSFILNLCITSIILGIKTHGYSTRTVLYSISLAMLTSSGILLYHIYLQIRGTRVWKTCSKWISVCAQGCCKRQHDMVHSQVEADDEHSVLLPQPLPAVVEVTVD